MKKATFLFFTFFLINHQLTFSQNNISDSAIKLGIIGFNYSFFLTGGDMANRFGNTNMAGLTLSYKNKNNLIITLAGNIVFGMNVKEPGLFDNVRTSEGYLITGQGLLEDLIYEEWGSSFVLKAGKIQPWLGPNPNSGLLIQAGIGFIEHKIKFKYSNGPLYQLEGDYVKGYDRLTNGLTLYESVGYQYFSNKNLGNLHFSFEFYQAFTKNRRSWNFDTNEKDDKLRLDLLFGFNIGLDLPLYHRAPEEYYYN